MEALVRDHILDRLGFPRTESAKAERRITRDTWISGNERIPVRLMTDDHIRHSIKTLTKHPKKFYKGFEKEGTIRMFRAELNRREVAVDKFLRRFTNYRTYIETPKRSLVEA